MPDVLVRFAETIASIRRIARGALPAAFILCIVIAITGLLMLVSRAGHDHDNALASQRKSYEVISVARLVDGTMAKAESTLARYVISMDQQVGLLYQSQWQQVSAQLDLLRRQVRGNPIQMRRVANLREAYRERTRQLNDIALRTNYKQRMGSLARFHEAGKSATLPRINALLDAIIREENNQLQEHSLAVNASGSRSATLGQTQQIVGLILLVLALVLAWLAKLAWDGRRSAQRQAEFEAIRAYELEEAVETRTAQLAETNIQLRQEAEDRAQAEESLRQMQKLEAVGQLTGGIAHDFNNMLAVVVGGLELARRNLSNDPDTSDKHLVNALEGANRASALTRRLLAFARSEPLLPAALDPDDLIAGMAILLDRTIGDQIRVEFKPGAEGWMIWADRHQLENALLNLAVNARDAMDGRGVLTIAAGQVKLKQGEVGDCAAGDYVTLSVGDTGSGMSPEVLARVFEPFFTTKAVGKGTGLGLSQIFGFVGQCQGEIGIQSAVGKGTTVTLYLPRRMDVSAAAPAPTLVSTSVVAPAAQSVSIIVVEDDPRVLRASLAAIEELGHHPISCDHPSRLIDLLDRHPEVAMIMTDVLMPDMTGPEMIQALPARHRHLPVLFVTGFAGDIEDAAQFAAHEVLRKPYTLAGLQGAIDRAIAAVVDDEPHRAAAG